MENKIFKQVVFVVFLLLLLASVIISVIMVFRQSYIDYPIGIILSLFLSFSFILTFVAFQAIKKADDEERKYIREIMKIFINYKIRKQERKEIDERKEK